MTERVPTPVATVQLIKAILNQDRRERHAAGYKQGTNGLAKRIAAAFGMKLETVLKIMQRKRHKHVSVPCGLHRGLTREPEVLEKIRQRRIREGRVAASWRGDNPARCMGRDSYRKRLRAAPAPRG
jgi:hypothetical protein